MIKDYLLEVESGLKSFALTLLVGEGMAKLVWLEEHETEMEEIFETCKTESLRNLYGQT